MTIEEAQKFFTPSEQEQLMLILEGKCPHNQGWNFIGHGHNSEFWQCMNCGEIKDW